MPRTPRNDRPEEPRTPRRTGQDAGVTPAAIADREPAGRAARNRSTEGSSRPATDAQLPTAAAPAESPEQQPAAPSYDDVARRAYELYQQRGSNDGQEVDDWLRAEQELREGRGRRDDGI